MTHKKKLIEVALPLEAINRESAREKSIRYGHPSTLHLWWARRPLAACRAVLFAQLVDDPSAHPKQFPSEHDQELERRRLFALIERLVVWENASDETLLSEAYAEILKSTDGHPPPVLDPFAGGGSIPLEAQRLGLTAYASDLNPVPILINRALIEVPARWSGQPPTFPGSATGRLGEWPGASGLAEDVTQYGRWLRDEAYRRLGHLYPPVVADPGRRDVIAWIWARDVKCANPACGVRMPLVNSFTLSRRRGREAHVRPVIEGREVTYTVEHTKQPSTAATVGRSGATCLVCGSSMSLKIIREEGRRGNLGSTLLCVVAEGDRRRLYLPPDEADIPVVESPDVDLLSTPLPEKALGFRVQAYGLTTHGDLYTPRQQLLLTTLADLIPQAVQKVRDDGGSDQYARDVGAFLALLLGRVANRNWEIEASSDTTVRERLRDFYPASEAIDWIPRRAHGLVEKRNRWIHGDQSEASLAETRRQADEFCEVTKLILENLDKGAYPTVIEVKEVRFDEWGRRRVRARTSSGRSEEVFTDQELKAGEVYLMYSRTNPLRVDPLLVQAGVELSD